MLSKIIRLILVLALTWLYPILGIVVCLLFAKRGYFDGMFGKWR